MSMYGSYRLTPVTPPCGTATPPTAPTATPEAFGAVGNGIANDQAAIVAALASLGGVGTLVLTPGKVYNHDDLIIVNGSTSINGGGYRCLNDIENAGTLASTNPLRSAVKFNGSSSAYGTIFTSNATSRGVSNDEHKVVLFGNGNIIKECKIDGSRGAGFYAEGASNYDILNCICMNTQADSFHNCCGSNNGYLLNPYVVNSGDDGVAVVSYSGNGAGGGAPGSLCYDITIDNPVVRGSKARGCSIVGGLRITYNNVDIEDTLAAGVYIASEPSYTTWGVRDSSVNGGVVRRANYDTVVQHGALLYYADYDTIQNTIMQDIDIYDTAGVAAWHLAAYWGGANPVTYRNICVYAPARTNLCWDATGGGLTQTNVNYC